MEASAMRITFTRGIVVCLLGLALLATTARPEEGDEPAKGKSVDASAKGTLRPAGRKDLDRDAVRDQVDPQIFARFKAFRQCADCGKIYWRGSHYQSMLRCIEGLG